MLPSILRILAGVAAGYVIACVVIWRMQTRIALPGNRQRLPDPAGFGLGDAEVATARTTDGVQLKGWYLPPKPAPAPGTRAPALVWFYGNMESVGGLAPVLRDLRPPGIGLLIFDYRGYGESGGTPSEDGLYRDADAAWRWLLARPDIDRTRLGVYGRSIGSAPALYVATERPVKALVLDSPFTSAKDLARAHYWFLPPVIVTLSLDNETRARHLRAPLLVFHGTDDEVAPLAMGRAVAEAGRARELVLIQGARHNETYDKGGKEYREKLWGFWKAHL